MQKHYIEAPPGTKYCPRAGRPGYIVGQGKDEKGGEAMDAEAEGDGDSAI